MLELTDQCIAIIAIPQCGFLLVQPIHHLFRVVRVPWELLHAFQLRHAAFECLAAGVRSDAIKTAYPFQRCVSGAGVRQRDRPSRRRKYPGGVEHRRQHVEMLGVVFRKIGGAEALVNAVDFADQRLAIGVKAQGGQINLVFLRPLDETARLDGFVQVAAPLAEQAGGRDRSDHLHRGLGRVVFHLAHCAMRSGGQCAFGAGQGVLRGPCAAHCRAGAGLDSRRQGFKFREGRGRVGTLLPDGVLALTYTFRGVVARAGVNECLEAIVTGHLGTSIKQRYQRALTPVGLLAVLLARDLFVVKTHDLIQRCRGWGGVSNRLLRSSRHLPDCICNFCPDNTPARKIVRDKGGILSIYLACQLTGDGVDTNAAGLNVVLLCKGCKGTAGQRIQKVFAHLVEGRILRNLFEHRRECFAFDSGLRGEPHHGLAALLRQGSIGVLDLSCRS